MHLYVKKILVPSTLFSGLCSAKFNNTLNLHHTQPEDTKSL